MEAEKLYKVIKTETGTSKSKCLEVIARNISEQEAFQICKSYKPNFDRSRKLVMHEMCEM